ncbi:hypothetical protein B0H19DRAFT_1139865 [Mycena capillaripes]|nr:hypothetical protein B0H19DRAFT_1139865 [Mycena capillaripes]
MKTHQTHSGFYRSHSRSYSSLRISTSQRLSVQNPTPTSLFCIALASSEFAESLTNSARIISQISDKGEVAGKCLGVFVEVFKKCSRCGPLRVAVRHGLLSTILACAQRSYSDMLHQALKILLPQVLAPASVHYNVLADLATAYFAAAEGVGAEAFWLPEVFEEWTKFTSTVRVRLEVLRAFDSKDHVSRRVCDNVEVFLRSRPRKHFFCQSVGSSSRKTALCAVLAVRNSCIAPKNASS